MKKRLVPISALLLIVLAACGTPSRATGQPAGPTVPPALILTEADLGHTVTAVKGQTVAIQLTDRRPVPGSATIWTVTSSDSAILELTSSERGAPAPMRDNSYQATFTVHRSGIAKLVAIGATTCEAMLKSACPDRTVEVVVQVS